MNDKYHNEWIIRELAKDCRIFKEQSRTFHFLADMAYNLDNSIETLDSVRHLLSVDALVLQLELLKRKCFYLRIANSIGRLWKELE